MAPDADSQCLLGTEEMQKAVRRVGMSAGPEGQLSVPGLGEGESGWGTVAGHAPSVTRSAGPV